MRNFTGGSEGVNARFDGAGRNGLPPLPHRMTAADFAAVSLNDWIHRYLDGFAAEIGDEVTDLAIEESFSILASRGVQLSGEEVLGELCSLLTADEQYAIWRRTLGLDRQAA